MKEQRSYKDCVPSGCETERDRKRKAVVGTDKRGGVQTLPRTRRPFQPSYQFSDSYAMCRVNAQNTLTKPYWGLRSFLWTCDRPDLICCERPGTCFAGSYAFVA